MQQPRPIMPKLARNEGCHGSPASSGGSDDGESFGHTGEVGADAADVKQNESITGIDAALVGCAG